MNGRDGMVRGARGVVVDDCAWMVKAISLADEAARLGEVPVGAVLLVPDATGACAQSRVFLARNEKESRPDPTAHAEMLALRAAAATLGTWRVGGTLYVTKEPCLMCAGAIVAARVERLVYGCDDPKAGAAGSVIDAFASTAANHRVVVEGGVEADATAAQLRAFFAARRGERRGPPGPSVL